MKNLISHSVLPLVLGFSMASAMAQEDDPQRAWDVYKEPFAAFREDRSAKLAKNFSSFPAGSSFTGFQEPFGEGRILRASSEFGLRPPMGAAMASGSFAEFLPDGAAVSEVRVWHDDYVRGIQLAVRVPGQEESEELELHGVATGEATVFRLGDGETLRQLRAQGRHMSTGFLNLQLVTESTKSQVMGRVDESRGMIALEFALDSSAPMTVLTGVVGLVGATGEKRGKGLIALGLDGGDFVERLRFASDEKPYQEVFQRVSGGDYRLIPPQLKTIRFDPKTGQERIDFVQPKDLGYLVRIQGGEESDAGENGYSFKMHSVPFVEMASVSSPIPREVREGPGNQALLTGGLDLRNFDSLALDAARGALKGTVLRPSAGSESCWSVHTEWNGRRVHLDPALVTSPNEMTRALERTVSTVDADIGLGRDSQSVERRLQVLLTDRKAVAVGEAWMLEATLSLDRASMSLTPEFQSAVAKLAEADSKSRKLRDFALFNAEWASFRAQFGTHYVRAVTFGRRESYQVRKSMSTREAAEAWRGKIEQRVKAKPFGQGADAALGDWTNEITDASHWVPVHFELGRLSELAWFPAEPNVGWPALDRAIREQVLEGQWNDAALSKESVLPIQPLAAFGYADGWTVGRHVRGAADFDGDGRDDVYGIHGPGMKVAFSTGTGFEKPKLFIPGLGSRLDPAKDQVLTGRLSRGAACSVVLVTREGAVRTFPSRGGQRGVWPEVRSPKLLQGWNVAATALHLADATGDGNGDLIAFDATRMQVWKGDGRGNFASPRSFTGFHAGRRWDPRSQFIGVADIDGDRKADVMAIADGVYVAFSSGDGFEAPAKLWGYFFEGTMKRYLTDVDGREGADLVSFGKGGVGPEVTLSKGRRFPSRESFSACAIGKNAGWNPNHPRVLADIDGGGVKEFVGFGKNGVVVTRWRQEPHTLYGLMGL